jgi:hypothetical protein
MASLRTFHLSGKCPGLDRPQSFISTNNPNEGVTAIHCQPGAKRGRRRRGWRRLPVGEVTIRRGATNARASWAGREAEAQWEEGGHGRKKIEWATAGPEVTKKFLFRIKFDF